MTARVARPPAPVSSARRIVTTLVAIMLGTSCGGDPGSPDVTPTVTVSSTTGSTSVASGKLLALTAHVTDRRGQAVASPTLAWSSSNESVATVSPAGVVSGSVAGTTTISAASLGVNGSLVVTVTPGTAAKLVMRTQPTDQASGTVFTTPPVVEVRDARDNLVTGSGTPTQVTVSLAGVGTIVGVTTVAAVQGVATFNNLAVVALAGPHTLVFSAPGTQSVTSASFTLGPGAPVRLAFRVAPAGGGLNAAFTTQPIVEVQDAAGNVASSASLTVTSTITAGTGTLTGALADAENGVASFTALGINGTPGTRTLTFEAAGLAAISSTVTPCDPLRAPQLTLSATARTLTGFSFGPVVADTVAITDPIGSCSAPAGLSADVTSGAAWLAASLVTSPTRLVLRAHPATLPPGSHQASVTVSSSNAGTVVLPVTFDVGATFTLHYASDNGRIDEVDVDGTLTAQPVVRSGDGAVVAEPVVFTSRSPTIATVAANGTITGRLPGRAWIVAHVASAPGVRDSIFLNVTNATGPVLRAILTEFSHDRGSSLSVTLSLDTRGATVGAAQLVFTWPTISGTPSMLRLDATTAGTVGSPVIVSDAGSGTTRISVASASGISGVITLGRFDFTAVTNGSSQFVLRIVELIDLAQQPVDGTALQYPVVVR